MKTSGDLYALARARTWNKDLVLWHGSEDSCRKALGGIQFEALDILDLFDEGHPPDDDAAIGDTLVSGLRNRLQKLNPGPTTRKVLLIRSAALLARHRAGCRELYDWFCNDFGLAILVLELGPEASRWPDEITCDPDGLLTAFVESGSVKDVYGETQ